MTINKWQLYNTEYYYRVHSIYINQKPYNQLPNTIITLYKNYHILHSELSLTPDRKGLVTCNPNTWLWPTKSSVTNQNWECLIHPITFELYYSIMFAQLKFALQRSWFQLLVSIIILFLMLWTLKGILLFNQTFTMIKSDVHDVIVKQLYCVSPDPCDLGRDYSELQLAKG